MKFIKFDPYDQKARLIPALSTLPPFILLNYFYLHLLLGDFVFALFGIVIGEVSLAIVFVYLLMELNRFISKMLVEKRQFNNELLMPTTDFLMYSDPTYSENHKNNIRNKISQEFNVTWPTRRGETADELSARQSISEAVSLVRAKMKGGRLILQHNIHYGLARNLIGGAYIALVVSTVDFIIFMLVSPNQIAVAASLFFVFLYGSLIVFRKFILSELGKNYAKVLYQEYLAS